MLSARLVLALLQPLTQAFLITLFVAFLSTFRQTRVITLLMGLQLQLCELLFKLLLCGKLWFCCFF